MDFEKLRGDNLSVERIELYLTEGDVNHRSIRDGRTLLHRAAESRRTDLVKFLAERGADLNAIDEQGWTPLHVAVDIDIDGAIQNGEEVALDTAQALIQVGAREDLPTDGSTPRDTAAHYGPHALALYDQVSRLRNECEPTLEAFFGRCSEILLGAGFRVGDAGSHQLRVFEAAGDATDPLRRVIVPTDLFYHRRHEEQFRETLVAELRERFARLRKQRGETSNADRSQSTTPPPGWGKRDGYVWVLGGFGSFTCCGFLATMFGLTRTMFGLTPDGRALPFWLSVVWGVCLLPSVPYWLLKPFARKAIFAYCIPLIAQVFVLSYPVMRIAWGVAITLVLVAAYRSQRNRRAFKLST